MNRALRKTADKGSNKMRFRILKLMAVMTALTFFGCEQGDLVSPANVETIRDTDELTFLQPNGHQFNKTFYAEQLITAQNGGVIIVGDDSSGYCKLTFDPGDLAQDETIGFSWDSQSFEAEFSPHGLTFAAPVKVQLSYENANVTVVEELFLKIWYWNEVDQQWELIGGQVNPINKVVRTNLQHFSRYTVATDDD